MKDDVARSRSHPVVTSSGSEMFERKVRFEPGYCALDEGGGIASMRIRFVLTGPKGAIQWLIGTDWFQGAARRHLAKFPADRVKHQPDAWDLGYHAHEPQYEEQAPMDHCEFLGGPCYYDGSGLSAERWIEGFLEGGEEWLWPRLEQEYRSLFEGEKAPDLTPPSKLPEQAA